LVRPGLARCFVGAYMRLKEEASEEKGNLVFGLIKPLDDNLVFYGFSSASLADHSCDLISAQAVVMGQTLQRRLLLRLAHAIDWVS